MNDAFRKTSGRRRLYKTAVAVLALCGCAESQPRPAPDSVRDEAEAVQRDGLPVATATLKVVDRAGFDAALAELHGQVVLVDFWAPWCAPCLEQMPHTAQLAEQRGDEGLAVVTVCMDDPYNADAVKKLLAARGATATTNLLSRSGGGSEAMEAFEIPGGALPHYRLYDREGKLRELYALDPSASEQFGVEDIDRAVSQLLTE